MSLESLESYAFKKDLLRLCRGWLLPLEQGGLGLSRGRAAERAESTVGSQASRISERVKSSAEVRCERVLAPQKGARPQ